MRAEPVDSAQVSYAAALEELEQILVELDDDRLDVDLVAERVQRAAELIRVCRERITGARLQVERVVAALEAETSASIQREDEDDSP
jgi:exodeoxyribonuclease VII small subunit